MIPLENVASDQTSNLKKNLQTSINPFLQKITKKFSYYLPGCLINKLISPYIKTQNIKKLEKILNLYHEEIQDKAYYGFYRQSLINIKKNIKQEKEYGLSSKIIFSTKKTLDIYLKKISLTLSHSFPKKETLIKQIIDIFNMLNDKDTATQITQNYIINTTLKIRCLVEIESYVSN